MSAVLTAVVLAVAFPFPAPAAEGDAAALLAKHAAYVGWSGEDGSLPSLVLRGVATRDGKERMRLWEDRRGPVYRAVNAHSAGDEGFTGRVFWRSNSNGFTVQTVGDAVRPLVTLDLLEDERLGKLPATIVRTESIDGVATPIVRVKPEVGVPIDLAVDPQTGAYKRYVLDPGGRYERRVDVLGYADAGGGKRIIGTWRVGNGKTVYRWTSVRGNVPVADDALHPPKQRATWSFGPPESAVPLTVDDKRISVDAVVNGHRGRFIVDTGAFTIALSDTFARNAGATHVGRSAIVGIGGGAAANDYHVDTIAFGPHVLHDVVVVTGLDESTLQREGVDGYIGFDLFAGAIVDMNLDEKTMRILDPAKFQPDTKAGVVVRVDLSTGQPRVPMLVAGRVPVIATLDTGDAFHALFSHDLLADRVGFFSDPNSIGSRVETAGVNGSETDDCGQLESLQLGPIVYRPVPACVSYSMDRNDVLVGYDFLKNFDFVFDYPDGMIVMTPRKR